MKRKRSVLGIILTVIGVVMLIAGATTDWWYPGARKGFNEHQTVAVAAGVVLLLVGGFLCAKAGRAGPAAAALAPEPESASAPEEPAPPAEEPPKTE